MHFCLTNIRLGTHFVQEIQQNLPELVKIFRDMICNSSAALPVLSRCKRLVLVLLREDFLVYENSRKLLCLGYS